MRYLTVVLLAASLALAGCASEDYEFKDLDWTDFENRVSNPGPYMIGEKSWRNIHLDYLTQIATGDFEGFEELLADSVRLIIFDGQEHNLDRDGAVQLIQDWRSNWSAMQYDPLSVIPITNEQGVQTVHAFYMAWQKSPAGQLISQYVNQLVVLEEGKIRSLRHYYRELDPLVVPDEFKNSLDADGRLVVEYDYPYEIGRLAWVERVLRLQEAVNEADTEDILSHLSPYEFYIHTSEGRILEGPPEEVIDEILHRLDANVDFRHTRPWALIPIYHPASGKESVLFYAFDRTEYTDGREELDFVLRELQIENNLVSRAEIFRYRIR